MGVELIDTNRLAVQAEYVVKKGVPVNHRLISALRVLSASRSEAIPKAS